MCCAGVSRRTLNGRSQSETGPASPCPPPRPLRRRRSLLARALQTPPRQWPWKIARRCLSPAVRERIKAMAGVCPKGCARPREPRWSRPSGTLVSRRWNCRRGYWRNGGPCMPWSHRSTPTDTLSMRRDGTATFPNRGSAPPTSNSPNKSKRRLVTSCWRRG